jgi:vacuolar-type H+-ATPase subunit F/Vma7
MPAPVFIGDEVTAVGFRLAGASVQVPDRDRVPEVFDHARQEADLVLITAEYARALPAGLLDEALRAIHPLVLVIPDARGKASPPDMVHRMRAALGLEA